MKTAQITATYMDHMGSDLTVVNAARASFDKESTWDYGPPTEYVHEDRSTTFRQERHLKPADAKLIRFLARGYRTGEWDELVKEIRSHGRMEDDAAIERALLEFKNKAQHWAPFAHPQLQVRVTMPIFLARQMVKHQVGGVWSEVSRRYVSDEPEFWFPEVWHTRPGDVKQGSGAVHEHSGAWGASAREHTKNCLAFYMGAVASGIAPEEARIILPQNTMTTVVWTGSLLFWARVGTQRLDGHAQLAAQELAAKIEAIVQPRFPVSWSELVKGGLS